ncbi:MAG: DNA-3-methyladenine glycosylase [Fimbriimonadaceae bacterium]|nr:DNA-3-methyladenine glycosylase [Chitinophagales bacterium]
MKLNKEFYIRTDTVKIARELLGKKLVSNINGKLTSGIICETEAYCGPEDRGCHAYNGRFTDRTKIMYAEGGVTYVYICYGIHNLFNVITHGENNPHAILIRAIEPVDGIEFILERRKGNIFKTSLGAGPGLVSQCLGFTTKHTGISLTGEKIWIEDAELIPQKNIIESARVGMNFEGRYKLIPWRFRIKNSLFTSRAK